MLFYCMKMYVSDKCVCNVLSFLIAADLETDRRRCMLHYNFQYSATCTDHVIVMHHIKLQSPIVKLEGDVHCMSVCHDMIG